MRAAAVEWSWVGKESEPAGDVLKPGDILSRIRLDAKRAYEDGANLIVFPGFTGLLYLHGQYPVRTMRELTSYANGDAFRHAVLQISEEIPIAICPGSYWSREGEHIYAMSCVVYQGQIRCEQKQLYLARWEREIGLTRGERQQTYIWEDWQIGLVTGTDVFYPQVSRALAMAGVNLMLAPVGLIGEVNRWQQISGVWSAVQQNQFFAVESGCNGTIADKKFWGRSAIHAPVEMTPLQDGFLAATDGTRSESGEFLQSGILSARCNLSQRDRATAEFNVLRQLHPEFYRRMNLFGGKS